MKTPPYRVPQIAASRSRSNDFPKDMDPSACGINITITVVIIAITIIAITKSPSSSKIFFIIFCRIILMKGSHICDFCPSFPKNCKKRNAKTHPASYYKILIITIKPAITPVVKIKEITDSPRCSNIFFITPSYLAIACVICSL